LVVFLLSQFNLRGMHVYRKLESIHVDEKSFAPRNAKKLKTSKKNIEAELARYNKAEELIKKLQYKCH